MIHFDKIQLWADELKTTTRSQTKGALEDEHGNCCVGVACRLFEIPV